MDSVHILMLVGSSLIPRQLRFYLLTWEKAWEQYYVTDQKWWTQLVCNVDCNVDCVFCYDGNVPTQYAASTASVRTVKFAWTFCQQLHVQTLQVLSR